MQHGRIDLAIACFRQSIRLASEEPDPYNDLGDALAQKGHAAAALAAHLRALTFTPRVVERYVRLGRALCGQHRYMEATLVYREALCFQPDDPDIRRELGGAFLRGDRPLEAIDCYHAVLAVVPNDPDTRYGLACALALRGEWDRALEEYERALELRPTDAHLHIGRGDVLVHCGRFEEAATAFSTALSFSRHNIAAIRKAIVTSELLGRSEDVSHGWLALGQALELVEHFGEARTAFFQVYNRNPDSLQSLFGLARCSRSLGELSEAVHFFKRAINHSPESIATHVELGCTYLQTGNDEQGWDELAWYYEPQGAITRYCEQPLWDGSPLNGKTILLWMHRDQGYGDTIMFLRYARFAKEHGGYVIGEFDRQLVHAARIMPDFDRVIALGDTTPRFDVHAPLVALPSLIPASRSFSCDVPYLTVCERDARGWRERLKRDGRLIIALAWTCEETIHLKSLSVPHRISGLELGSFDWLAHYCDIRVVSAQCGLAASEVLLPHSINVETHLTDKSTLGDVAAMLTNCDLVITADVGIAHLAGALGRLVWTLLPSNVSWPWPSSGAFTAWYPTMRLFRPDRAGEWSDVVSAMQGGMRELIRSRLSHATGPQARF